MKGKRVKLIKAPAGKTNSENRYIGTDEIFVISSQNTSYNYAWYIRNEAGATMGWVYEYEMKFVPESREEIQNELKELEIKANILKEKINWLDETGNTEFDDNEFKVYQTLKLLEKDGISIVEKSKAIAALIRG